MSDKVTTLALEASKLNPRDRALLIEHILDGLQAGSSPVDKAWLELAQARLEGVRGGTIETVDFDEFLEVANQSLDEARARRPRRK